MIKDRLVVAALLLLLCQSLAENNSLAQSKERPELKKASTGKGMTLCGSCSVPKDASWQTWLADKDEPGEPIEISGVVYKSDGVTPDSGITIFLYQTDSGGYYHRPKEDVFHPKIFGWIKTGKDGKYLIHSIKPAPEILDADGPAHIHAHVFSKDLQEHFIHEFWFEGDKRISANDKKRFDRLGSFSPIIRLTKNAKGILTGVRNIKVRPTAAWTYESE